MRSILIETRWKTINKWISWGVEVYRHILVLFTWPPHRAVKVWWRDLQSCWWYYWPSYTSNQCQTSTIQEPTCCYTPTWWPNLPWSWLEIEIFSWSEAWNPPTWGCKSMVEVTTMNTKSKKTIMEMMVWTVDGDWSEYVSVAWLVQLDVNYTMDKKKKWK